MKKILCTLFVFFIIMLMSSCTLKKKIAVNSFGANNIPATIESNNDFSNLETPVREDGAVFEGWYSSMNFDSKYKINSSSDDIGSYTLFAKYDKCYSFSLRYGTLGCYGVEDVNAIKLFDGDYYIDYFIPSGEYNIAFTKYSEARVGSIMIMSNDGYTAKDGYPYLRQVDYKKTGQKETVTIAEGEHVFITHDSVFLFQRTDVNSSYVTYKLGPITNNLGLFGAVFGISFAVFFVVFTSIAVVLVIKYKKKIDKSNHVKENY